MMKIFKKIFYLTKFYFMYFYKIRNKNACVNNYAGKLVFNSVDEKVDIPKVIWIYWEGDFPEFVNKCVDNIRKKNQNYQVVLLNPENVCQYSALCLTDVQSATPQQRADLLRFDLIYNHGGIWLDASILVYENLDWIQHLVDETKTEIFAFYRQRNTTNLNSPVIENWLLASVPNNPFFKLWFDELYFAIKQTPQKYIEDIRLNEKNPKNIFQKIGNLHYLVAYVACQKVIQRHAMPSITLIDCDQNAFFYQVKNRWVKERILIDLAVNNLPTELPKLIKLAGKERQYLCEYHDKGMYFENSFIDFQRIQN